MKHIVLITTSFPLFNDGSEAAGSFVEDFAIALADKVRITVIAPGVEKGVEYRSPNLNIYRFRTLNKPLSLLKADNPLHWLDIFKTLLNGRRLCLEVARQGKIDHILALWVLPSGFWARSVSNYNGTPYSTWALGSDIWSLGRVPVVKNVLKKVLQNSCFNFADGLHLKENVSDISGRCCDFLPSTRKVGAQRVHPLSDKSPYRLAFLGRWHHNKGVDLLIDSLMKLDDFHWSKISEIVICGGGPLNEKVISGGAALSKNGRNVTVRGYLNKKQSLDLLLGSDYVLIPSRIESIPVIFSDAAKCRCPVVCMPVGDLPELIARYKVGVVARETTAEAFTEAIIKILDLPPASFSGNLKECAKDFNLLNITDQLLLKLLGEVK